METKLTPSVTKLPTRPASLLCRVIVLGCIGTLAVYGVIVIAAIAVVAAALIRVLGLVSILPAIRAKTLAQECIATGDTLVKDWIAGWTANWRTAVAATDSLTQ
ncbi:hypothetical protein KA344_19835 [bacterium]|nr:hypothetical protein [bacterium]